ncbi:MAG: Holliday junction branch migration protein RuvA [Thioalkalivibrio sp.]|nr:Holliday junction branch migration protein RuvA [Thioalkalivibrio sp.]
MIARLEGILRTRDLQSVLLDVGGVGYEIEVPLSTLASLPEAGAPVVLFTHLVVREDAHILFGFLRSRDRDLFRRLIRVNGIGARLALAMLSTMAADELAGHITGGNVAALTRVPGIGKRTARGQAETTEALVRLALRATLRS